VKSSCLTSYIVVAMVLGIAIAALIHDQVANHAAREELADYISYGSMISCALIKMIIARLVLSSLLAAVRHISGLRSVGRVGARATMRDGGGAGLNGAHKNELAAGRADHAIILLRLPHWEKSDARP
jgi:Sodium:dicarboxylate symporter family